MRLTHWPERPPSRSVQCVPACVSVALSPLVLLTLPPPPPPNALHLSPLYFPARPPAIITHSGAVRRYFPSIACYYACYTAVRLLVSFIPPLSGLPLHSFRHRLVFCPYFFVDRIIATTGPVTSIRGPARPRGHTTTTTTTTSATTATILPSFSAWLSDPPARAAFTNIPFHHHLRHQLATNYRPAPISRPLHDFDIQLYPRNCGSANE